MVDADVKVLTSFLVFFTFFRRDCTPPRLRLPHCACLLRHCALLRGVEFVLGQCEIGTDHNRVAASYVPVGEGMPLVTVVLQFTLSLSLSLLLEKLAEEGGPAALVLLQRQIKLKDGHSIRVHLERGNASAEKRKLSNICNR